MDNRLTGDMGYSWQWSLCLGETGSGKRGQGANLDKIECRYRGNDVRRYDKKCGWNRPVQSQLSADSTLALLFRILKVDVDRGNPLFGFDEIARLYIPSYGAIHMPPLVEIRLSKAEPL